jgi:hypothetical protein
MRFNAHMFAVVPSVPFNILYGLMTFPSSILRKRPGLSPAQVNERVICIEISTWKRQLLFLSGGRNLESFLL